MSNTQSPKRLEKEIREYIEAQIAKAIAGISISAPPHSDGLSRELGKLTRRVDAIERRLDKLGG